MDIVKTSLKNQRNKKWDAMKTTPEVVAEVINKVLKLKLVSSVLFAMFRHVQFIWKILVLMVIVWYWLLSIVNDFFINNNRWIIVSVTSISFDFQYQSITRACLHEGRGAPGRWGNPLRWDKKKQLSFTCNLSQDYWMVAKHVNKKNVDKPCVLAINALLQSLAALAATFRAVAFYCYLE